MRRGYMPPGDTPNLKYWERESIQYPGFSRFEARAEKRFKELGESADYDEFLTADSRAWLFNYFNDNRWKSPWISENNPDGRTFVIGLEKSHISYIVHGGIYLDIFNSSKFIRLGQISNLGITRYEILAANHKRDEHSIIAAIMIEHILRNNRFPERDVNLGIISALLHDVAMPPMSDYGKLACREQLDEEENVEIVLGDGSFDSIFDKYGVSRNEVIDSIRGNGVVGQLLNSKGVDLDKIAYTGVDLSRTYGSEPWGRMRVVRRDPFLFDIYEDIKIEDGKPVFADPQRLFRFLYTRALMFEKVHYAPVNRAREAYIKCILQKLWGEGKLTKQNMLEMNDGMFLNLLFKELGEASGEFTSMSFPIVEVGRYATVEEAQKARDGDDVLIDKWRSFNPATKTLTRIGGRKVSGKMEGGEIVQFRKGYPEQAKLIDDIAKEQEYVGVYKREEGKAIDLELGRHLTHKRDAERRGVPRHILKYADVEPKERVIWALEKTGKIEEAKRLQRTSEQL